MLYLLPTSTNFLSHCLWKELQTHAQKLRKLPLFTNKRYLTLVEWVPIYFRSDPGLGRFPPTSISKTIWPAGCWCCYARYLIIAMLYGNSQRIGCHTMANCVLSSLKNGPLIRAIYFKMLCPNGNLWHTSLLSVTRMFAIIAVLRRKMHIYLFCLSIYSDHLSFT